MGFPQYLAEEEYQRIRGDFLGGRGHAPLDRKIFQESTHFVRPQGGSWSPFVKLKEACKPVFVSLFGTHSHVSEAEQENKPLFSIWVHKSAARSWKKLGNSEPNAGLKGEIPRFKKDPISGAVSTYISGAKSPSSPEEVKNMKCAAVWEEHHVVERLADQ